MSSKATYAIPREQSDGDLLHIGHQCDSPTCSLVDFLPLKCQHCSKSFCADHFKPTDHSCEKYDVTKHDRIVPQCPLCNIPIAIPPGEDPNLRMERHINTECSVMTGRATKISSMPTCASSRCRKKLFAPIECDKCHQKFCAEHRYPTSHTCTINSQSGSQGGKKEMSSTKAAAWAVIQAMKTQTSSTSTARQPLVKRAKAQTQTTASTSSSSDKANKTSETTHINPFSGTNRRAAEERRSQRQAMLARAKKGLLSEEEQTQLEADLAKHDKDDNKCNIM